MDGGTNEGVTGPRSAPDPVARKRKAPKAPWGRGLIIALAIASLLGVYFGANPPEQDLSAQPLETGDTLADGSIYEGRTPDGYLPDSEGVRLCMVELSGWFDYYANTGDWNAVMNRYGSDAHQFISGMQVALDATGGIVTDGIAKAMAGFCIKALNDPNNNSLLFDNRAAQYYSRCLDGRPSYAVPECEIGLEF